MNPLLKYLFMKNKKGVGEVKVETPMVLEQDPNLEKKNQMLSL